MPLRDFDVNQPRDEHGKWSVTGALFAKAAKLEEALNTAPAKLKRAPRGHFGDYEGEELDGPDGMGSVRALSEYEGPEYEHTNGTLRGLYSTNVSEDAQAQAIWAQLQAETDERIRQMDQTMSVSGLTDDAELHRVIRYGKKVFGDDAWYGDVIDWKTDDFDEQDRQIEVWESGKRPDLTGLRWHEKGYSSTSADPAVVQKFGERWKNINSSLEGEPVVMRIFVPKGTGGVQLAEWGHAAEILLQRDLTFEIIDDAGVADDGYRHIDVKVVTA